MHSMPDGFVVFDDVFVPDERVFLDGETSNATVFAHALGLWERLGGVTAMVTQADQLVGLAQLIAEANGLARVPHIRDKIDEMFIHATLLRAGLEAALANAHATPEGYYYPDELYTNVAKYQGAAQFHLMVRHLHDIAGGAVLTSPRSAISRTPTRPVRREVHAHDGRRLGRGSDAPVPRHPRPHGGPFGGWHLVTNLQSGGGLFAQRIVARKHFDMARAKDLGARRPGLAPVPEIGSD